MFLFSALSYWVKKGAFHLTKNSGLKFRVFYMTNRSFFGILGQPREGDPKLKFRRISFPIALSPGQMCCANRY